MEQKEKIKYQRNCLLGTLGAALLIVGDLCISIVPASPADKGLYVRGAYLNGDFQLWRVALLLVTGLVGMFFYAFGIDAISEQILPKYRMNSCYGKLSVGQSSGFVASAATLHFLVGTLAYWVTYLSEHIGREQAIAYVDDYYNLLFPAVSIVYIPTALLMLTSLISLLAGRTVMKRSMIVFHIITWQLIFVLIPDIRQAMGADISTLDYVFSQASGNTACLIWLVASFVYSKRNSN